MEPTCLCGTCAQYRRETYIDTNQTALSHITHKHQTAEEKCWTAQKNFFAFAHVNRLMPFKNLHFFSTKTPSCENVQMQSNVELVC